VSNRARRVAAIGAALAVFGVACTSTSNRARSAPASSSTSTTIAVRPSTSTTALGVLPPREVKGLHIAPSPAPPGVAVAGARWLRVTREDGKHQRVAVFRPTAKGRHPVVVYLHGSSGLAETELAWAHRLAARGFIVVAGCYLNPDAAAYQPSTHFWIPCPELPDVEHNTTTATEPSYRALIDVATALPDAKPGALGVVGVSLGAIVALTSTAAPGVKAIVADSGYGRLGARPVSAPVLLLDMDFDSHVEHGNVLNFELTMHAAHKKIESRYYPGDGHVVTLSLVPLIAIDAMTRATAFLHRTLGS
jgi:dienelactone hydrolase